MKQSLQNIVGSQNLFDNQDTLEKYSCDQSFVSPCTPDFLIFPHTTEEIQEVVRLANQTKTPLVPLSSGLNLHGAAVPEKGGIIVNLSKMDKILSIDENNWFAVIEPGVTYQQLQDELKSSMVQILNNSEKL